LVSFNSSFELVELSSLDLINHVKLFPADVKIFFFDTVIFFKKSEQYQKGKA